MAVVVAPTCKLTSAYGARIAERRTDLRPTLEKREHDWVRQDALLFTGGYDSVSVGAFRGNTRMIE